MKKIITLALLLSLQQILWAQGSLNQYLFANNLLLKSETIESNSNAECCGWIGHVVEKAGKAVVKTITAPTETAIKAAGVLPGITKPSDVFQPLKDLAGSNADLLATSKPLVTFLNAPQDLLYEQAGKFASKLGPGGTFVFDLTTFTQSFYNQILPTSTDELINLLKGQNPLTLVAAPLAAAIHQAETRHAILAKPLPADVLTGLQPYFPAAILNKAKYAVGTVEITLPNFIGQSNKKFMGNHYAVVVGDIIVFNKVPPSFKDNPWWWAHEVNHIVQYTNMGVEVFAYNYIKDIGKSIEDESNKKGDEVLTGVSKGGPIVLVETKTIFSTPETFAKNDKIIWQCTIEKDNVPASYVVTQKGKILAVNPLTGEYVHIGYAEPPTFIGSSWTFKTTKVEYAVLSNGDIMQPVKIVGPSGKIIRTEAHKIGEVKKIDPNS